MQHIHSPLQAQVVQWLVQPGEPAAAGDVLVILEAMKMEHEIRAPHAGRLTELFFQAGETVGEGDALARWTRLDASPTASPPAPSPRSASKASQNTPPCF